MYQCNTKRSYYKELKTAESKYEKLKKDLIPSYLVTAPLFVFLILMIVVQGLLYRVEVNRHNIVIKKQ